MDFSYYVFLYILERILRLEKQFLVVYNVIAGLVVGSIVVIIYYELSIHFTPNMIFKKFSKEFREKIPEYEKYEEISKIKKAVTMSILILIGVITFNSLFIIQWICRP